MNEIVNKFLLARDQFIPEMHVRQPGFAYRAFGPFQKTKKEIKNSKKQEIQVILTKQTR